MSINRRMAMGAAWMVGLRFFNRGIGFVSTLILARLLAPADFGLVAMAMVFMHLLTAISDFSVQVPLIQKAELDRDDMDSAWSLQLTVGVAQAAVLLALAQPAATFYGEPRLVEVFYVLGLIVCLKGLKNIGVVMFQREMVFSRDFALMASQRVAMFVVTMTLAVLYGNHWALVFGMLAGALAELALSYAMHPYRPRLCRRRWAEIFWFSKWLLLNNLLAFVVTRFPEFVLGRLSGPRSVGLFSIGYEVAMLPTTELVSPINRAALPGYSQMRASSEEDALRNGYLDVIGVIAMVALPAAIGIAAAADVLIPLLLGSKWLDVIPVVHDLALAGAIMSLLTNGGAVFLALGRPRVITAIFCLRASILVPGTIWAAGYGGVAAVATVYLVEACIILLINVAVILRALKLPSSRYLKVIYRPAVSAALMYAVVGLLLVPWLQAQAALPLGVAAGVAVAVGAGTYLASVACLWIVAARPHGAETRLLSLLAETVGRRSARLERKLRAIVQ